MDSGLSVQAESSQGLILLTPDQCSTGNILSPQNRVQATTEQYSSCKFEGVRAYICNFEHCGRMFNSKQKVQRHFLTHTGEKPFSCRFCDYSSSRKDQVKVHEYTKHYEQIKMAYS